MVWTPVVCNIVYAMIIIKARDTLPLSHFLSAFSNASSVSSLSNNFFFEKLDSHMIKFHYYINDL
jgi:hypothetical protein